MQVALLGPTVVRADVDAPTTPVAGERVRALLARLALDTGRVVPVGTLVDDLWGEHRPADELNALQSLVSRLRRAVPNGSVESTSGGYRLVAAETDFDAFETGVRTAAEQLRAGDAARAAETYATALRLWRGDPLADLGDVPFAAAVVTRWQELHLLAREGRLEAELSLGGGAVVADLETLVGEHPLRETSTALLIRALAATGRQAEALAAYDRLRERLADELGLDPGRPLEELRLAVLRGEVAPAAATGSPTNLRAPVTSFVGREVAVAQVRDLLVQHRLVTLVGPGGAGKTRLATEAARPLTDVLADGVWMAELAPVTDPDELPSTLIGSLGLRETSLIEPTAGERVDATGRLVEALADRELLLVLDNCEHLVGAAAVLVDELLARAPRLRVLATSREPLGITGEALCPVAPLPRPQAGLSVEDALAVPSVALFVDRAQAVRPDFTLDADTVDSVCETCARLDGLPLAIELAAARLRTLSIQQVADRLGDRFRLLIGGSRAARPRHQTLRAVVAWSWDLLEPPERAFAERVAVSPGGVTAESARAVAGPDVAGADPVVTADLLSGLVDKSLLQRVDDAEDQVPRFRMLETLREYGIERLVDQGVVQEVRAAHVAYFLAMAEWAEPRLRRPEQLETLARLDAEHDNLLAALRFAADASDADSAVRLAAALGWYWTLRGAHQEAAVRIGAALDVPGDSPNVPRSICLAMHVLNAGAGGLPAVDPEATLAELQRLRPQAESDEHPVMALLDTVVALLGDDMDAGAAARAHALEHPDPWVHAMVRFMGAAMAENSGDQRGYRDELDAALTGFRQVGDRWGIAMCLTQSAGLSLLDGDRTGAIEAYDEAGELMRELGASDDAGQTAARKAMVLAAEGELEAARATLLRAQEARSAAARRCLSR